MNLTDFTQIIGRGGHGEIRTSPKQSNVVIKISEQASTCGGFKAEFNMQMQAYQTFEKISHPEGFSERAAFLRPKAYSEHCFKTGKSACIYAMERLFPIAADKILYQLSLGEASKDEIPMNEKNNLPIRGHFIGFQETEKIVNGYARISQNTDEIKSNMDQLCYDVGRLLAILHLVAKLDGCDLECVLVKQSENSHLYKVAIIDFDQMKSLENMFEAAKKGDIKAIKDIVKGVRWSINSLPYFPSFQSSERGFNLFKKGYMQLAQELDEAEKTTIYSTIAEKVIDICKDQ